MVAARDGDRIVWSWHVWVTGYDPEADIFEWTDANGITYKYMDRNLGALSAEKYSKDALGLMYQWGRKDPFPEEMTWNPAFRSACMTSTATRSMLRQS